jgi:hypothetical protein
MEYLLMDYNIVCHGNSITLGATQTPYPQQLGTLLGGSHVVHNSGFSGDTTQELLDNFQSQVNFYYDEAKINIVIFWEATNQFTIPQTTVAEEIARQESYVALARENGWLVIVANVIQRGNAGTPEDWQADILAFNELIRVRGFADGFLDIWSLNTDFQNEFTGNGPVASYIDAAHLNTSRYGDIAADALLELPVATGSKIGVDINGVRTRVPVEYAGNTFSLDGINYYKDNNGVGNSVAPIGLTAYTR